MRVLALTRYGPMGASSRVRTLQYLPSLKEAGIDVSISPLLGNQYVKALYARQRAWRSIGAGYFRRLRAMHNAARFEVTWVEKECLPWVPAIAELGLLPARTRLLVDYDDAWFHRYDQHTSRIARGLLGKKIDAVMHRADLVTVGNEYLASRAREARARRIEYLPTVVDLSRYQPVPVRALHAPVVVGWIGSPSTAQYLRLVAEPIERLRSRHAIRCVAIGARPDQLIGTPFEAAEWTEDREVNLIRQLDIGIMPLEDGPFERGKCGYKLVQYMACGLPVIASPVGVNCELVAPGMNGELANSAGEWEAALEHLVVDECLRRRLGAAGRKLVERSYSLAVQAPRLVAMFQSLVTRER